MNSQNYHLNFKRKPVEQSLRIRSGQVPLLVFPELEKLDGFRHGMTTRAGGVSEGIYSTLNLGLNRGDREAAVRENFHRVAEALGVPEEQFVFASQTHTAVVRKVTEEDAGKGLTRPRDYRDVDALVTNVPGLVLSIFVADCVPVFLLDPVHKAVGLAHSGWRGTAARIGRETLLRMQAEYGTDPAGVFCGIGPSICQDCYEISRDVAEIFMEEFAGHEEEILASGFSQDKYHLNLWEANRIVLKEAGVLPAHIFVTDICTCCNPDLLFSHRASHGRRGNLGAFLMMT